MNAIATPVVHRWPLVGSRDAAPGAPCHGRHAQNRSAAPATAAGPTTIGRKTARTAAATPTTDAEVRPHRTTATVIEYHRGKATVVPREGPRSGRDG